MQGISCLERFIGTYEKIMVKLYTWKHEGTFIEWLKEIFQETSIS